MPQNLSPTSIADTPLKKERPKPHKRRANDDRRRQFPSSPFLYQYHHHEFFPRRVRVRRGAWRLSQRCCYDSDTFHFFSSYDSFTLHVPSPMTHSGLTNHDPLLTGTFHMTSLLTSL